jgi:hypothetical protein
MLCRVSAFLLLVSSGFALPLTGTQTRAFAPAGLVIIHMRTGDLRVRATDNAQIVLQWKFTGDHAEHDAEKADMLFEASGQIANVEFHGPARSGVDVELDVPRQSNLEIRLAIGDVRIEGVRGDKSVDVHIGDVDIGFDSATDYRQVDASVHLGDVNTPWQNRSAVVFGTSVKRYFEGKYMLHAHTGIGDVQLHETH